MYLVSPVGGKTREIFTSDAAAGLFWPSFSWVGVTAAWTSLVVRIKGCSRYFTAKHLKLNNFLVACCCYSASVCAAFFTSFFLQWLDFADSPLLYLYANVFFKSWNGSRLSLSRRLRTSTEENYLPSKIKKMSRLLHIFLASLGIKKNNLRMI